MEAAMQQLSHDERMRHLQQLAYGAVASDAERAAAAAELEALRRLREVPGSSADAPPAGPRGGDASVPIPPSHAETVPGLHAADVGEASVRRFRWAIAVGTAALFLGVIVGWHLGSRTETLAAPAAAEQSIGLADGLLDMPVADTSVLSLFDRAPVAGDAPDGGAPDDQIAPGAYRLLLTRPDGVTVHAVRIDGGKNVCVTVAMLDGGTASSCTSEGRFPQRGLWVATDVQGIGPLAATLRVDGSASITPPGSAVPAMPIAIG
jgi:hypothetical protein